MNIDYPLTSNDELTKLVKKNGLYSWNSLTRFIKKLPYGRNENRTNFSLVLSEKKGTCSSKHALLKCLAELNQIPNVDLFIGIYRMDKMNTPKIGKILCENHIDFIPKAHCYLKIDNIRIDFTFDDSDIKKIAKDIIQEIKIEPNQVVQFKVEYHKDFINEWLKDSDINFSEIWEIGEKCIKNLAL